MNYNVPTMQDNRRQRLISFRVSTDEAARLGELARAEGRSVSNFVRHQVLYSRTGVQMDPVVAGSPEIRKTGRISRQMAKNGPESGNLAPDPERGPENPKSLTSSTIASKQAGVDAILRGVNRKPR